MTHFVCPLCGLARAVKNYDPSNYDLDLSKRVYTGKGRGRGFGIVEEYSVLGNNEFSSLVANRVLDILKMFIDSGTLASSDILSHLNIELKNSSQDLSYINTIKNQENDIKSLQNQVKIQNHKYNKIKRREEQKRKIKDIIKEISNSMLCETEYRVNEGEAYLLVHNFYPHYFDIFERIYNSLNLEEWNQLLLQLVPGNNVLERYFKYLTKTKIYENNLKFLSKNPIIF